MKLETAPVINVCTFWDTSNPDLINKLSIACTQPAASKLATLRVLTPDRYTITQLKIGAIDWEEYTRLYWIRVEGNLLDLVKADKISSGTIQEMLVAYLTAVCEKMCTHNISLCCWEKSSDDHCHRKLVYDMLPAEMQGLRL